MLRAFSHNVTDSNRRKVLFQKPLIRCFFCLGIFLILFTTQFACRFIKGTKPALAITTAPEAVTGGPQKLDLIKGTATGTTAHHKIVLYAFSGGTWWVQPMVDNPDTEIDRDGSWSNRIHLGYEYAALLVQDSYQPEAKLDKLPVEGGPVLFVAVAKGRPVPKPENVVLQFSGYEWEVRTTESNRGGGRNLFSPANAWVDQDGNLHLRIAQENGQWTGAEVMSRKSFGYGTYRFVLQDTSKLDPQMAMTLFTWHKANLETNNREIDIEISRWGNPKNKNSQYVIQPFYLPDNSARFESPAGLMTHSFRWQPDQVLFQSTKGDGTKPITTAPIFQHSFTSGIPPPEGEPVCMNFYLFGSVPPKNGAGAEVVIEKFLFLP